MSYIIKVEQEGKPDRVYNLDSDVVTLGRDRDCDVVLQDRSVSSRHAFLIHEDGTLRVQDAGSMNGVYVDERRVEQAVLAPGGWFSLGQVCVIVMMIDRSGSAPRAPELDELPTNIAPAAGHAPPPRRSSPSNFAPPTAAPALHPAAPQQAPRASRTPIAQLGSAASGAQPSMPVEQPEPMVQGSAALVLDPRPVDPVPADRVRGSFEVSPARPPVAPEPPSFVPSPTAAPPPQGHAGQASSPDDGPGNLHGLFPRSLRSLEEDRFKLPLFALIAAAVLVVAWGAWALLGSAPVYIVSQKGTVEASASTHAVSPSFNGVVESIGVQIGEHVEEGQVLVQLDDAELKLEREEAQRQRDVLEAQLGPLREQIEAEERAIENATKAAQAARKEAKARAGAAGARAAHWSRERRALRELADEGMATTVDASAARARAAEGGAEARAHLSAAERMDWQSKADSSSREALVAALRRELLALEQRIKEIDATIASVDHKIDQCKLRAPVAGHVGEVGSINAGSVLAAGEMVARIVPEGRLRAVAYFPTADALGRLRPGQGARIRLAAFPWTQYGTVSATVDTVASESNGGLIRVLLELDEGSNPNVDLEHGLLAEVEVEVERLSPAELILRAAGKSTEEPAKPQEEGAEAQ